MLKKNLISRDFVCIDFVPDACYCCVFVGRLKLMSNVGFELSYGRSLNGLSASFWLCSAGSNSGVPLQFSFGFHAVCALITGKLDGLAVMNE